MLLDEKPAADLALGDIETLISQEVCESPRLEYKRAWWGDTDKGKREMLRDISAFANSVGGHIVLGVATQRGKGAGNLECPREITSLPIYDYAQKIVRSCRDNFDPIVPGIEAVQIAAADQGTIIVLRVPQSSSAPHMVTFQGVNQFWQRHGTDKQPMSTAEIEDVFMSRRTFGERLQELSRRQIELVRSIRDPVLFVYTSPIIPLMEEINIRDKTLRSLLWDSLLQDPHGSNCALDSGPPSPTLQGLRAQERNDPGQHIELHRSGFFEFTTGQFTDIVRSSKSIVAPRVAIYLDNFAESAKRLYAHLNIGGPIVLGCSLVNVPGYKLMFPRPVAKLSDRVWDDLDMDLGSQVLYNFDDGMVYVLMKINDRLSNAFGFDECPYYKSGTLKLPQ